MAVNCTCSLVPRLWNVFGFELCNGPLLGSWLLAVLIGTIGGYLLSTKKSSSIGSLSYSITYFTYAVMMSSGFVVHCIYSVECKVDKPDPLYIWFLELDVSLTSCIAVSFVFNGLIDLGLIAERDALTICLMAISYIAVFIAYFIVHVSRFMNFYYYSVMLGCGSYVIMQLIQIVRRGYWPQSVLLFIAALFGGLSLVLIEFKYCLLACTLGPWSIEGVWYYGSDNSMIFIFLFVWYTRKDAQKLIYRQTKCKMFYNSNNSDKAVLIN